MERSSKENQGLGEAKNGGGKEREPIKTRTTMFQWKIIIVKGKRMRQL